MEVGALYKPVTAVAYLPGGRILSSQTAVYRGGNQPRSTHILPHVLLRVPYSVQSASGGGRQAPQENHPPLIHVEQLRPTLEWSPASFAIGKCAGDHLEHHHVTALTSRSGMGQHSYAWPQVAKDPGLPQLASE